MKANEIMIGDWVFATDDDEDFKIPIRIEGITKIGNIEGLIPNHDGESVDGDIALECCDPIPITPKILEKNGFEFNGTKDWVFGQNQYGNINAFEIRVTPPQPNNEYWDEEATGFEVWDKNSDIIREGLPQIYVHELQHTLRLCGIEKEIVI